MDLLCLFTVKMFNTCMRVCVCVCALARGGDGDRVGRVKIYFNFIIVLVINN